MGSSLINSTVLFVSFWVIAFLGGACGGAMGTGGTTDDDSIGNSNVTGRTGHAADKACADDHQCPHGSRCVHSKCIDIKHLKKDRASSKEKKGQCASQSRQEKSGSGYQRLVLVPAPSDGGVICGPGIIHQCIQKCEQGMAAYCLAVGRFYEPLFMKDEHSQNALFGFQKACESGLSDGCASLGIIFYNGRLVPPQHDKAYHFSVKACDLKNSAGCANAARFAARGIGVSQNASLAKTLYDKACQLGHEASCTDYDILEKRAPTPSSEKDADEENGFADPKQTNGTDVAWVMCSTLESCDADLLAKIFTNIDFCVSQFNSSTFSTRKCRRFSPESAAQCIQDIRGLECNAFINTLFNRVPQPNACDEMCQ